MSLHYILGGAGPRPEYFVHQGSENTCVLCAINNLLGRRTYTPASFEEIENQWRQRTGQALRTPAIDWWPPEVIVDYLDHVGEADITRVPQENFLGPSDFNIYDNETYLIWTGYGNRSHLTAIRDGWWLDSRQLSPYELGQRVPGGGRQIATIRKQNMRGLWRVNQPSTSITRPKVVLTIKTYFDPNPVDPDADTEPEGADTEPESE